MKRLFETADLVLDDLAPPGDALVEVAGLAQRVSPASTVSGAAILHSVMTRRWKLSWRKEATRRYS